MKVEKKYTAMQIGRRQVNSTIEVSLSHGDIQGSYYNETHPKETFETEEEAIEWAYEHCKYSRWMIVPIVEFNAFDD